MLCISLKFYLLFIGLPNPRKIAHLNLTRSWLCSWSDAKLMKKQNKKKFPNHVDIVLSKTTSTHVGKIYTGVQV